MKHKKKKKLVCLCNGVEQKKIEEAIDNGASSLDEIFDRTNAGVGACGGTCRPQIKLLLEKNKNGLKKNPEED